MNQYWSGSDLYLILADDQLSIILAFTMPRSLPIQSPLIAKSKQMKKYAIGVDVGGSHISCKIFNLSSKSFIERSFKALSINSRGSKDSIFDTFETLLKQPIENVGVSNIVGIGLAFPGPIDYEQGIALFRGDNSKYLSLYKINIRTELSKRLGIDKEHIRFINDATAFAVGEYFKGELSGSDRSLAITLGTGFGAAFLDKGIPVINDNRVPKGGCLWHLSFDQTIADDYFSTRGLVGRYKYLSEKEVEGVKQISELYAIDAMAQQVFADFRY